jgi:hypothetical protein
VGILPIEERLSAGIADRMVPVQAHHSVPFGLMEDPALGDTHRTHLMNCCGRREASGPCVQLHGRTACSAGQAYYTRPPPQTPRQSPRFRVIQVQDVTVCIQRDLGLAAVAEHVVQYEPAMFLQYVADVAAVEIPTPNQKDVSRRGSRLGMVS